MAVGENKWQRMVHRWAKVQGFTAVAAFVIIATVGSFRGASLPIMLLSVVGAVLMASFLWIRYYRPARR